MKSLITVLATIFILNSCVWDAVDVIADIIDPPEEMESSLPPPEVYEPLDDDIMEDIDDIVDFPDVEAEFAGGTEELMMWIQSNIEYPPMAIEMDQQGKVYVAFVVKSDGSVKNVTVERGVSEALDREARRVIRKMPRWKPAEVNGEKVSARCRIPLVFTLQ